MNENLWDQVEQARAEWNVLEHPFYQRWSAGELSAEELARYSGQYRYATEAIARLSHDVAAHAPTGERAALRRHAEEESDHVAMWDGFVERVGGEVGAIPNAETLECVDTWTADDGVLVQAMRLFAIESGQPAISKTKREGLKLHYGIDDGPGNEYFRVHESADIEHANEGRELIERLIATSVLDADQLVEAAESAFRANWRLLDGVSSD